MSNVVPDTLEGQLVWLVQRVADLERRSRNRKRTGEVTEVDAAKGLARVKISEPDGKAYTSPWIPWNETSAGKHKTHYPVSVGEQVEVQSENGDLTDGVINRSVPSTANKRPSTKGDEYVLSNVGKHTDKVSDGGATRTLEVGGTKVTVTDGKVLISVGGSTFEFTGAGFKQTGGKQEHDGKNVGKDHKHGGIFRGGALTDPPAA